MLSVRDIYKTYEGAPLLNGLSFDLAQGEIIALLGTSGSGKSTLLRIIAGLEEAESGAVYWDGVDLAQTPAHQRGFGLMFQDYALFPHRNVYENIAFGLRMQKRPEAEIEKIVGERLKSIRMESFSKRPVTELSGGEQQRVALARALAPDPRLLMLDEPLGALDRGLREELTKELRQTLRDSHKPVIYVTHDRQEAFGLADRLLILHDGVIVQDGSPQELFERPANAWVAEFLGLGNLISANDLTKNAIQEEKPKASDDDRWLLRPFDAQIGESQTDTSFQFEGEILDCVYMGERYQTGLRTAQGTVLSIETPHLCVMGEKIKVYWPAEKVQCLKS
ncbi:MAG TPA: ABC transporter ATP-binding protein [Anaerolineaceae bacterium]|nr:ABC transporter ATP-binding protein [Anaerolineaceae bacterium]